MTESDRIQLLNEARQYYIALPVILPILEARKEVILNKLLGNHKSGRADHVAIVAELCAVSDLISDMRSKEQTYNKLGDKK